MKGHTCSMGEEFCVHVRGCSARFMHTQTNKPLAIRYTTLLTITSPVWLGVLEVFPTK